MSKKHPILIVEDDAGLLAQLKWALTDFHVVTATDKRDALAALRRFEPCVMIQDLGLPPKPDGVEEGFELLQQASSMLPNMKIIVMTGNEGNEHAIEAIRLGSFDYYQKPVNTDELEVIVKRAVHIHELEQSCQQQNDSQSSFEATDAAMLRVKNVITKVAPTTATCMLLGESGTGKEVMANEIHRLSQRASGPFVAINCAAIPENLIESELFGYERGAFTGANRTTIGKVEQAQGGTLFLDEIGDMPYALQAKLLRFLQERVIERVGGRKPIEVDVRIICATHKNIENLIAEQQFREDLYYRLCEIDIALPPLRARGSDCLQLARSILKQQVKESGAKVVGFSESAINAICEHPWPGNVRELVNRIKRALIMTENKFLTAADLCLDEQDTKALNLREIRDDAERKAINSALQRANDNISLASELLGVTRPTFYDLMKKHRVKEQ